MEHIYIFNDNHPLLPFAYSMEKNTHPNALPPLNAVAVAPRLGDDAQPLPGEWPCANAQRNGWIYVQDHRQRKDAQGRVIEGSGTPYWLPGDTHATPGRYADDMGPLPDAALLTRPEKTTEELSKELRSQRDARIAATDYLMAVDYPITNEARATITTYRQALRDLPAQGGFPWDGGGEATPWPVWTSTFKV